MVTIEKLKGRCKKITCGEHQRITRIQASRCPSTLMLIDIPTCPVDQIPEVGASRITLVQR